MSMPALGPGSGDVAYRMQGLRHTPVQAGLEETVPAGTILRLWLWAAVPALIIWAVFAFLALFIFAVSVPSPLDGATPGNGLFAAGSLLSSIVFWVVLLSARVDEPVAEWRTLLEERWQGADSAYAAIYGTLRRRGIPVGVDAVRVRSDLLQPEVVNNRLVISDRDHRIVVTVFPYGSSLYLGWTMSRGRRGLTLLGHFLKDLADGMFGRAASIDRMLRAERARALQEAVHGAVREGAEVAAQGLLVPLGPAFGAEVPVRDLRARAVPPPGYGPHAGGPVPGGYVAAGPGPDPYAPPVSSSAPPPTVAAPAPEAPGAAPHPHPAQPGPEDTERS